MFSDTIEGGSIVTEVMRVRKMLEVVGSGEQMRLCLNPSILCTLWLVAASAIKWAGVHVTLDGTEMSATKMAAVYSAAAEIAQAFVKLLIR